MNFPIKKITFSVLTMLIAVSAFASQAKADVYQHVDELALSIQTQSRLLIRETVHYRYTPQYRKIVRCTMELRRLAGHIHDVTHFEGNLQHLAADLRDLDAQFHDLEALFDQVEANASRGCTTIAGNTAHVKRLLNSIEDSIHHLQDDVNQMQRRTVVTTTRRVVTPVYTQSVFVPTRPVYAPSTSFAIQYSRSQNYGRNSYSNHGRSNRGHNSHGHNDRGHNDRGHNDRGHNDRGHNAHSNRGNNSGSGFSIGGGSSRINIRF